MSNHYYIAFNFSVSPIIPGREILIAQLSSLGFESFVETVNGVEAYIQNADYKPTILDDIQILSNNSFSISYKLKNIDIENWNKKWESNFKPIIVNEICQIRAPFHDAKDVEYDIIIQPKMSFGTGHHETTRMMIKYILNSDFKNKDVLDMGCGTSVLSILAEKRGAKKITAIDIDNWCYENSLDNILKNSCKKITVMMGDATLLVNKKFDIILANINRNILLSDINKYYTCLNSNGLLFLSGFYKKDVKLIEGKCSNLGLQLIENIFENKWVALKFTKS